MERIQIEAVQGYEVLVGRNLLEETAGYVIESCEGNKCSYRKVAVISDDLAGAIYGRKVLKSLRDAGMEAKLFTFPNGERSKNSNVLQKIYEFLIHFGISRKDLIIALGGGVTGDMAGFAAATYLRGVDYIQIPTTLIAQTDSSVGGKTAIDTPFGKNLIGAFYQPRLVLCDIETLSTLPEHIFNEGMGEVIKYALLSDRCVCPVGEFKDLNLFTLLEQGGTDRYLDQIISLCIKIKADFVKKDEREQGERMLLNLGHTIGHAVERASEYSILHGAAVAIGMSMVVKACANNGLLDETISLRLSDLLTRFHLPQEYLEVSLSELVALSETDKKHDADGLNVVLCHGIGDCRIQHMTLPEWKKFLETAY